jgi:class 3 adenylate cyclase
VSSVIDDPAAALEAGREAYARHDWAQALELLGAAEVDGQLGPDDLERLAEAAWWSRQLDLAIRYRERAYTAYSKAGQKTQAAVVALALTLDYIGKLKVTLSTGALRRAQRLLAGEPDGPAHAQLAAVEGLIATHQGDLDSGVELGQRARDIARRFGAVDPEILGLLVEGHARIARGEVDDGLALLDEATSAAVGGELSPVTTGLVYCATISACGELSDYQRAGEWTEAAELWCEQEDIQTGFPGICRVRRAEVKRFQGHWSEAEEEAARAAEELMNFSEDIVGAAYYEIGEVRLLRGEFEGAEEAFQSAHQFMRSPEPGRSLLRLAQGQVDAAASSIRRALAEEAVTPLARAKLLPARVTIALTVGDLDAAHRAADEMEEIAEQYRSPSPVLKATAASARAQVAVADGDPESAVTCCQAALRDWRAVGAPYETARTRVVLASALEALGEMDAATLELESALATFEQLGAIPDAKAVREQLGELTKPEHVTRTFLFTDVVRSTRFMAKIGDEAWAELLRVHERTLRGQFQTFGGEEVDHAGDGFFVAFQTARAAIDCAAAIQRGLSDEARFGQLQVRIGVHEAPAMRHGATYRGNGVHAAARIMALAGGGEIVASVGTIEASGVDLLVSRQRAAKLKGIREPIEVATIEWQQ